VFCRLISCCLRVGQKSTWSAMWAVRPTLEILGDTIATILETELDRPWDQIFADNKEEWSRKVCSSSFHGKAWVWLSRRRSHVAFQRNVWRRFHGIDNTDILLELLLRNWKTSIMSLTWKLWFSWKRSGLRRFHHMRWIWRKYYLGTSIQYVMFFNGDVLWVVLGKASMYVRGVSR
jgi:hypothetical protein